MLQGVQLAVEDVNRRGGAGGHPLETFLLDSAVPGADTLSRQRATVASYERFVADPAVIAAIGPQTSEESRAVAPFLSRADLATITPSATTFDITDPALRATFRPGAGPSTSEPSAPTWRRATPWRASLGQALGSAGSW